jgi:glycosyltransferase involved in cell wall biosynthesis
VIITIVTPSLNGIDYLSECIESVRRQEANDVTIEHIFVDGGSTDGTPEFARSQGCTVLTREECSPYAAQNKGILNSTGALIGTIGCDDILLPGALDAVVRHYERTRARWLIGGCQWLTPRGVRGVVKPPPHWLSAPMFASLGWNCIFHNSTFVCRNLFKEFGGFDDRFSYAGDYEFFARLLHLQEPFARITQPLCAWRRHGANRSMTSNPALSAEIQLVQEQYGPASPWCRMLYRYFLKLWLNGNNPKWFTLKRVDALRHATACQALSLPIL